MENAKTPTTVSQKSELFLRLSGRYTIAQETTQSNIKEDISILMESTENIVQILIDASEGDKWTIDTSMGHGLLFSLLYQLQMIGNLANAMEIAA
jgi:hypothetical protein